MISFSRRRIRLHFLLFCLLLLVGTWAGEQRAVAEVGLIVEGPTGGAGFFDDMGHAAIWVSRGCLDAKGIVYYCEGTPGVVLAGTGYWTKTGAAAIPAQLYFLGPQHGDRLAEWNAAMASIYPSEPPENGQKYLGRLEGRRTRVDVFPTTPEQDRAAIKQLNAIRTDFHFRLIRENCSNFARSVLRLWLGPDFHVRQWTNLSIVTPLAVEEALKEKLNGFPGEEMQTYHFPPPREWRWRRSARDVCSAVLLDPKYAVPMGILQPEAFAGFGGCYGVVKLKTHLDTRNLRHDAADNVQVAKGSTATEVFEEMTHEPDRRAAMVASNVPVETLPSQEASVRVR